MVLSSGRRIGLPHPLDTELIRSRLCAPPVVDPDVDAMPKVAYAKGVAVPASLLKQLLALGERERVELAHALLDSVNDNDEMSDAERDRLHAVIEQSISEIEAG